MNQFDTIRKALETVIKAHWTLTPVKFENCAFKQPDLPWISFYIKFGKSFQTTISNRRSRVRGLAVIQIFTEKDTGSGKSIQIADAFATLLQYRQILLNQTDIALEVMNINDVGERPTYFQQNAIIPFDADTTENAPTSPLIIRPSLGLEGESEVDDWGTLDLGAPNEFDDWGVIGDDFGAAPGTPSLFEDYQNGSGGEDWLTLNGVPATAFDDYGA